MPRSRGPGRPPVCLVLMPMYAGFEGIRARVARILARAGLDMRRLEVEIADSAWHQWLLDSVEESDVALVDVTDHNPFVMYELGHAHGRRLPTLYIMNRRDKRLPATIRGSVCSTYGSSPDLFDEDLGGHLMLVCTPFGSSICSDQELLTRAESVAERLNASLATQFTTVQPVEFNARLAVLRKRGGPDPAHVPEPVRDRYLASLILQDSDLLEVMQAVQEWSVERYPAPMPVDDGFRRHGNNV